MNTVITSFTENGYHRYGREFLNTFDRYWPQSVKLVVYQEGQFSLDLPSLIEVRPIEEVKGLPEFMGKIVNFPIMCGFLGDRYDINHDAGMGRKTFMQCHASKVYGGKVFWIDADSITHTKVPENFLDEALPDDKLCCYLGRKDWYYTESGFIGFNNNHPSAKEFMEIYLKVFETGMFLTLPGWHDCFAFDMARRFFTRSRDETDFLNLADHVEKGEMHPFVKSLPGKYMDHLKGPRKKQGHSKEHPLWDGSQYKTA